MSRKIDTEKKILKAGLTEFGEKGYDKASTNNIYQKAGVSKGLIFKYFPTKFELFYRIFSDELTKMVNEIEKIDYGQGITVIDKIVKVTLWKLEYTMKHPLATNVLMEAFSNPPQELATRINDHIEQLMKLSLENFFNEIDMSQFNPKYSKEDVIRNIQLAITGLQKTYQNEMTNLDYLKSKYDESMQFLKIVIKGMEK